MAALGACSIGCAAAPSMPAPDESDPLAALSWLAGSWAGELEGGARVEEQWSPPAGGTMIGFGRTVVARRTVGYEFLLIELVDGEPVYQASPGGRSPPTPFGLSGAEEASALFTNPQHDFPQEISYRRAGAGLEVSISGVIDGEVARSSWRLERVQ